MVSFRVARTTLVREPSISVALVVLVVAPMRVHLVFFIHITSDNVTNVMALAFGVLIVLLVMPGLLWIVANMNHMAMMDHVTQMPHWPRLTSLGGAPRPRVRIVSGMRRVSHVTSPFVLF